MADEQKKRDVTTKHERLAELQKIHERIADAIAGQDAIKARKTRYLPRLPRQTVFVVEGTGSTVDEYANYLERASWLPFTGRAHKGLLGLSFRKPPQVDMPERQRTLAENNVTLTGETLETFSRRVHSENLGPSFGVVVTDYSVENRRPYLRFYDYSAVINWRPEDLGGRPVLTQVVLYEKIRVPSEFGAEAVEQYRMLELRRDVPISEEQAEAVQAAGLGPDDYPFGVLVHRIFRNVADGKEEDWQEVVEERRVPDRARVPLSFIPAEPVPDWSVPNPPLLDVADMNIAHYRNSADHEHGLHLTCVPTSLFTGFTEEEAREIRIGGLAVSERADADGKYMMTGGQGLADVRDAMAEKKAEMALVGARLLLAEQKRAAETAEAHEMRLAGDDATLQNISGATSAAIEQALVWFVWWDTTLSIEEAENAVSFRLTQEFFDRRLSAQEAVQWMTVVQAGHLSEDTFLHLAHSGRVMPPGRTVEEEKRLIAADERRRGSLTPTDPGMEDDDDEAA